MSCSGNCSSCGSDCQKQPLRHPNITGAILGQFMMEMAMRSQKNAAGEITEDVMDDMGSQDHELAWRYFQRKKCPIQHAI